MSAVKYVLRWSVKCPVCGSPCDVKPVGDGYATKRHRRPLQRFEFRSRTCDGGPVAAAGMLEWAQSARAEKAAIADNCEARRQRARDELAKALADIDAREATWRAEIAALDRAIAKLAAKAK